MQRITINAAQSFMEAALGNIGLPRPMRLRLLKLSLTVSCAVTLTTGYSSVECLSTCISAKR